MEYEEGEVIVDLSTDKKTGQNIPEYEVQNPQLKNLARELDDDVLAKVASKCFAHFVEDDDSRKEWLEKLSMWLKVYSGTDTTGTKEPFSGSSKDHIPILCEAVNQFGNRANQVFFNQSEIIKSRPIGHITESDIKAAKRVEKYLNYKLFAQDKNYKKRLKQLFKSVALYGSYFRKRFWNPLTGTVEVVNIEPENFIVPMGTTPCELSDLDRKTHRYWISKSKARNLYVNGFFLKEPKAESVNVDTNPITEAKREYNKAESGDAQNLTGMIEILEQHCFCDLDGSGFEKPYIVWLCKESKSVLRIAARYKVYTKTEVVSVEDDGSGMMIGAFVDNSEFGEAENYTPIEYFTHYYYSVNPNGFYAEGLGSLIGEANRSINKILRQSIDAGTLANIPSGFISKQIGVPKGELKLRLGEYTPIDASMDDIQKGFYTFEFRGPNPTQLNMMSTLIQRSDRLGMLTEAITGTTDKVIQPTTFLNLIEQGLQPLNSALLNIVDSLNEELNGIYEMIGSNLSEDEYYSVLDGDELISEQISPLDFDMGMEFTVTADVKNAIDTQRQEKAGKVFEILMNNPMVQQSPQHIDMAYRQLLKAFDIPEAEIAQLLPPVPEPQPPVPAGPAGAGGESMGMIADALLAADGGAPVTPIPAAGGPVAGSTGIMQ